MKLNEQRLNHIDIAADVTDAIQPIKAEIATSYIDTISTLSSADLAEIIRHNYSDGVDSNGNIIRKPRSEIKPWNGDYAYAVLVQAAMHQLYPKYRSSRRQSIWSQYQSCCASVHEWPRDTICFYRYLMGVTQGLFCTIYPLCRSSCSWADA